MTTRTRAGVLMSCLLAAVLMQRCTDRGETTTARQTPPAQKAPASRQQQQPVDPAKALSSINDAIPVYSGAQFRTDLTQRDEMMIRSRFGEDAEVYTLASDDSYPQVYHYYTTYLAQFRAFPAPDRYPAASREWRTLEVKLNEAMQDPFIPGEALDRNGTQVTLQIAETEADQGTVIRYIVTPGPPAPMVTASNGATAQPVAR